jgi:nitrogen fixation/metabolism regulation signal transduction histidine kinase
MVKISTKVAIPVILAGMFAIVVFIALNPEGLTPSFYIILLLLSIFIFFYGLYIGQSVAHPIEKILKRAVDLSKGDTKARFYLETKDEFGELAQIFNKIADDLENSRDKAESSEKSVNIKVKAKTADLEETINALEQKVKNRTIEIERLLKQQGQAVTKPSEAQIEPSAKVEIASIVEATTKIKAVRSSKKTNPPENIGEIV